MTPTRSRRRLLLTAAALTLSLAAGGAAGWHPPGGAPAAAASTTPPAASYDAATRHDAAFNATFEHRFATVRGVRMHYVTGGRGPALVLLHGWPQTWYEWRKVLPALAERHTVYALDLPGLGDSQGSPASFDKKTLARYVHGLLRDRIGLRGFDLVAHDLGGGVGFQYVSQFPEQVRSYVHMDYPLPGPELPAARYRTFSWHMAFNSQRAVPERLIDDPADVREYLTAFYPQVAHGGAAFGGTRTKQPFTGAEVEEFVRTYSRRDVLRAGFELYRSLDADERDNAAAARVDTPTLLLTATGSLAATRPAVAPLLRNITRAAEIPESGHWLAEENPEAVVREILSFTAR
ncbi:pimeloyl-ACP methyl ester carboxylesterase [Nonomuraea thailandensis]|uniref:Pimeloyl-ACP methyl ester carboxylesterase n=1 Tax=Nonomuraea thailandensis TaxID=1188745 RepID=A0A9X2GTV6_9ACTN|nr:alpha/beta fold hydrolase [Nonomuraea thailandensis]MCP2365429.1 pimeloyl-ACP methyl ester carboxylesterase [Nonomuraea thailandensis]